MTDTVRDADQAPPPPDSPVASRHERRVTGEEEQAPWVGPLVMVAVLALVGITGGLSLLIVILSLVVMIFLHELGHYLAARRGGMKVTEFFIGFGPRLWSFRRGETEYGFKAIPAGAYVRIIGMNNLDEVDPADEDRTYRQKSYPARLLVAVAGSAMHFLMALVLLYALLVTHGIERDEAGADRDWSVEDVSPASAAAELGLEPGDRIVSIDGVEFDTFTDMRLFIRDHPGDRFDFVIRRDGETFGATATVGESSAEEGVGSIGVLRARAEFVEVSPLAAVPETATRFGSDVKTAVVTLGKFFSPSNLADFFGRLDGTDDTAATGGDDAGAGSGDTVSSSTDDDEGRIMSIVGATRLGRDLTETGVAGLLIFMYSINVFVGVFNLVPLLPLDGGHVVVATYERLRSRRGERYHADAAKLLPLTYAVVLIMLTVGLAAMYLDIADPVTL